MNQKKYYFLFQTLLAIILPNFVFSYTFSYSRVSNCVLQTDTGCVFWHSSLNFQKKLDALCFPQQTYLQGKSSKIKMSQLKVGDQIMVYKQNRIAFEQVKAWLHRDTEESFQYNFVEYQLIENFKPKSTEGIENGFYISGMHNVAVIKDHSGKVTYQFAQNLSKGDSLFGHGPYLASETPKVTNISKTKELKGVYAPYTSTGNYFITNSRENEQLILVHCFAHVSTKYHTVFDYMITLTPFWSVQPDQTSYIHPLSKILKDLFPSVLEIKTLNHMAEQMSQSHKFLSSSDKKSNYRYETQNAQRDFSQERKALIIIDKVISMVETFV